MAAKKAKKEEKKIVLERLYNVPLRKEFLKVPKYKRSKKAVTALKQFLSKHMKSDKVKVGKYAKTDLLKTSVLDGYMKWQQCIQEKHRHTNHICYTHKMSCSNGP